MIRYEFQKLFAQKLTIAILAVLLVLNGILVYHTATEPLSDTSSITRVDIAGVYEHYEGWPAGEIALEMETWLENYQSLWYIDEDGNFHQPTQEQLQELVVFTDRVGLDAGLRSRVLTQVQSLTGYEAYLDSVQETAERLSQSSLYSNENSFAHRNLLKTAEVYLPLYDVEVTPGDSSAVTMALEGHTTTVLLLFGMVLIVLNLTLAEREEGLLLLVKPTVNGRLKTAAAKILTLILSLLVLTLAFYGTNLVITGQLFGFGNLSRSIQSLDGYMASPWMISVGQYIGLFLGAKYLGVVTVSLVFFLICMIAGSRIPACVMGAGVLMVEVALYVGIPYHSWLSILRQMNLAALVDTRSFFSDYLCLNVFGFPVGIGACSLVACVLVSGISIFLSCRRWSREENLESVRSRRRMGRKSGISTSLLSHEAYKLLITCKGGVLLILLLAVQMVTYSNMNAYETESEAWYQHYTSILLGNYSQENQSYMEQQQEAFDSVYAQQQEYYAMADRGEISREYASFLASKIAPSNSQQEGFYRAMVQYEYLKTQTEGGKTVQFLSTTGYNYLLDATTSDVLDAAKLCFVLAVCLSMYFTMEDSSGMMRLILPSPAGKGKVMGRKLAVCGIYLIFAWGIAFLPRIAASLSIYPMEHSDFAAASLPQFENAPQLFGILGYFTAVNLSRLAAALLTAVGIFLLSRKVKHPITVLVICLAVLELPVFLNLLGVVEELGLLPLLTGHWMYS